MISTSKTLGTALLTAVAISTLSCSSTRLSNHYSDLPNDVPKLDQLAKKALRLAETPLVYSGEKVEILSEMLYYNLDKIGDNAFARSFSDLSESEQSALRLAIKRSNIEEDFPLTSEAIKQSERRLWPAVVASEKFAQISRADLDAW